MDEDDCMSEITFNGALNQCSILKYRAQLIKIALTMSYFIIFLSKNIGQTIKWPKYIKSQISAL